MKFLAGIFVLCISSTSLSEPDRHLVLEHSIKWGSETLVEFYDRDHGVRCYVTRGSYDVTTISCVKEAK